MCTKTFLDYTRSLITRQKLDRIVINKGHLTITTSDYYPCIAQLGWYIQQIRTQIVWLTAILPPVI
jgi:hypothetical protein